MVSERQIQTWTRDRGECHLHTDATGRQAVRRIPVVYRGKITGPCETNPPASKSDTQWYQTWASLPSSWESLNVDTSLTDCGGKVTASSENTSSWNLIWDAVDVFDSSNHTTLMITFYMTYIIYHFEREHFIELVECLFSWQERNKTLWILRQNNKAKNSKWALSLFVHKSNNHIFFYF